MNWLIDRHVQVSYLMADEMHLVSIFMNKFDIRDQNLYHISDHFSKNLLILIYSFFQELPDLIKDQVWDDLYPEIFHTPAAEEKRGHDSGIGSTANFEVRTYKYYNI